MKERLRNEFLHDLLELVSIHSVTDDMDGISKCFSFVEEVAERFGFNCRRCAGGRVLEVVPKNATKSFELGIITHVDTVPFNKEEWTHNPLGEITDGRVYGRGVIDDKVGVLYSLYVMKDLEKFIRPSWKLIIGSSEEGEWIDMEEYKKEKNVIPDFLFTIDGDGIQNGCRGTLNLRCKFFKKNRKSALITSFETPNGVSNTVPDLCRLTILNRVVDIDGVSVHSSIPEQGVNAIIRAFELFNDVFEREYPDFAAFMNSLKKYNDGRAVYIPNYPGDKSGQLIPGTTVVPTMCSMEDMVIELFLNIRISPTIWNKEIINEAIAAFKTEYDSVVRIEEFIMPAYISIRNEQIKFMQDAYEKVVGRRPEVKIAKGTGYNAAFENAGIFGPRFDDEDDLEEDLCHAVDESRSIEDLEKFYDCLYEYIKTSLRK